MSAEVLGVGVVDYFIDKETRLAILDFVMDNLGMCQYIECQCGQIFLRVIQGSAH